MPYSAYVIRMCFHAPSRYFLYLLMLNLPASKFASWPLGRCHVTEQGIALSRGCHGSSLASVNDTSSLHSWHRDSGTCSSVVSDLCTAGPFQCALIQPNPRVRLANVTILHSTSYTATTILILIPILNAILYYTTVILTARGKSS